MTNYTIYNIGKENEVFGRYLDQVKKMKPRRKIKSPSIRELEVSFYKNGNVSCIWDSTEEKGKAFEYRVVGGVVWRKGYLSSHTDKYERVNKEDLDKPLLDVINGDIKKAVKKYPKVRITTTQKLSKVA